MPDNTDILIRIDGQTHRIDPRNPASIKKIPWPQRKRLIEVLESIQAADYVAREPAPGPDKKTADFDKPGPVPAKQSTEQNALEQTGQTTAQSQSESRDMDAVMQRLLTEQTDQRTKIPSKASVYKWLLIIFAVIYLLILLL